MVFRVSADVSRRGLGGIREQNLKNIYYGIPPAYRQAGLRVGQRVSEGGRGMLMSLCTWSNIAVPQGIRELKLKALVKQKLKIYYPLKITPKSATTRFNTTKLFTVTVLPEDRHGPPQGP